MHRFFSEVQRASALALLLFFVAIGLTGCANRQDMQTGSITLEFWTLQMDAFADTLRPMFAEYQRAHPNVRIKWVDVPFSEGEKRTLTAMMSPQTPDVINLNPDFSAILASRQALVDMNAALPDAVKKAYLPVAWQAATLRLDNGQDITFGLPWYITSSVTLYNQDILQRAGYSAPPKTVEELPAFARTVHEKTGAYGLMPVIAESGNFLKELRKIGVPIYDAQGRAVFATEAAVTHLNRFVAMYKAGTIPAETVTESHRAAVGRYQGGTLGMMLIGPNFLKIVQENAPGVYRKTGVAPQFPPDAAFKDFSLMVLVVPRHSRHPKEAAEFAAFITNGKNQLALAQAAPVLPSITDALKTPYFSDVPAGDRMAEGRAISARQLLNATEAYRIRPGQSAINQVIDHYVQLALLGQMPASEALHTAQDRINDLLETGG